MTTFEERNNPHIGFQNEVIEVFEKQGYLVNKYGQETNISDEFSNSLYQCGNNITAKFIRYKPDLALILVKDKEVFLCEVKSSDGSGREAIALEKNSYEISLLLSKIGIKIFLVFGDFTYNFVENLEWETMLVPPRFHEEIDNYKQQYPSKKIYDISRTKGSDTPFILIKKQCLIPLQNQ